MGHVVSLVRVRVKPELRERFLQEIEANALASERDEPGCLQFNVLHSDEDENVYLFLEVYKDEAARQAHRTMPHFAAWHAAGEVLDGRNEVTHWETVFPADSAYWGAS